MLLQICFVYFPRKLIRELSQCERSGQCKWDRGVQLRSLVVDWKSSGVWSNLTEKLAGINHGVSISTTVSTAQPEHPEFVSR